MEIAFHCPNCLADLIFDESKKYTCCFCHTTLTGKDEVRELEGGYYVGEAWNDSLYHRYKCDDCAGEFVLKSSSAKQGCPLCSSASITDNGPEIGAMPKRIIPFAHTKQQAEEIFLDYLRNNSAVGRQLATDENKALLHKVYVPSWIFTYEVVAHARLTVTLRNKANDSKTIMGLNAPEQLVEFLSPIRSSISRFSANRKGAKDASSQPSEHVTGGVLSWQGIPFDASGVLQDNVMNCLQPYDQSKLVNISEKTLGDTPVLAILKDPITCMQEFMDRVKKWTRQMIMDAHSDSYDILHFADKTDYPLGIGELVLFPIWYMKGDYSGREYYFAMNGQNGEIEANIPMAKVSGKATVLPYQSYWDKSRCTALNDTHFEFNIHDPNIEILDYSFFEKPRDSRITADGRKKEKAPIAPLPIGNMPPIVPKAKDDLADEVDAALGKELDSVADEPLDLQEAVAAVAKEVEKETVKEPSKAKKPSVPLDVEVVTDLKSLSKKLSKEEAAKLEKEKAARLRAAARENAKKPMEAAAEAPSWAKAVTPPQTTTTATNARPVRKKKPAMERPSVASSGNKPLWERTDEERIDSRKQVNKPASLAEQVARSQMQGASDEQSEPRGRAAMPVQQKPIWSRDPEEFDDRAPLPGPDLMSLSSFLDKRAKEEEHSNQMGEPAREVQVRAFEPQHSSERLVESDDEVLAQARREAEEYAASLRAAQERYNEDYYVDEPELGPEIEDFREEVPEEFRPEIPETIPEEIQASSVDVERPEPDFPELEEYSEDNEDMVANITFSFNKKNAAAEREMNRQSGSSIPRMPEQKPSQANGMAIMNSDYDSGVLPGVQRESSVVEYSPIADPERIPEVSENYFGSDENDRPLAYRPKAPLAMARDVEFVEEVEHHPELDENNRPLAERPAAPLARVTEVAPSVDYIVEHGIESNDNDVHQIPSLAKGGGRWGEMPEATETPSWAKPQNAPVTRESRLGNPRERTRRPSREELMEQRDYGERPAQRQTNEPMDRSYAFRRQDDTEGRPSPSTRRRPEDTRPSAARPSVGRPGSRASMERPGSSDEMERPGARTGMGRPISRTAEPKPEKQVPIWERVPDSDRPMPAWGMPAYRDERPAGSLTKPKDQIIDVEKPRTQSGLNGLGRSAGQVKEILPSGEAREFNAGVRGVSTERAEQRYPARPQRPAPARRDAAPQVEVEMPVSTPRRESPLRAERQMSEMARRSEQPAGRPGGSINRDNDEDPIVFSNDRPRTFAQRRQMEEQERQRPAAPARRSFEPEEEREPEERHFAQENDVPSLARGGKDIFRQNLDAENETVRRAMRDLPEFDPDGPSPFRRN